MIPMLYYMVCILGRLKLYVCILWDYYDSFNDEVGRLHLFTT